MEEFQTHAGRNRGHWPGRPEITAAIFGNYNKNESKP
jgi:hypothetical protein